MLMHRRNLLYAMAGMAAVPVAGSLNPAAAFAHGKSGAPLVIPRKRELLTEMGDFRNACLSGMMACNLENFSFEARMRDLALANQYLWGSFWSETGDVYVTTRGFSPYFAGGIYLVSNRGGRDGAYFVPEMTKAYKGQIQQWIKGDHARWQSVDYQKSGKFPLEVEIQGRHIRWREADLIDVEGELVPYATQWYSPGKDPGEGEGATCNVARVRGTVAGVRVDGWMGIDAMYLPSGQRYQTSRLTTMDGGPGAILTWTEFANEYVDGSCDYGIIGIGLNNWGLAHGFNDKGEAWSGQVLHSKFRTSESNFPRQIDVAIYNATANAQETWTFRATPREDLVDITKMLADFPTPYTASQGYWQKAGDTRKIKRATGWADNYSDDAHMKAYQAQFVS